MSWRLATKTLFTHGPMTVTDFAHKAHTDNLTAGRWLRDATIYGAVNRTGLGRYELSLMGLAMCEGRVNLIALRPGGHAWQATWMQPLPRYAA